MTQARQSLTGQSLVEYGVIGTLVVAASIVGLSVVGGNLGDTLQALKGDLKNHSTAAATAATKAEAAAAAAAQQQAAAASELPNSDTISQNAQQAINALDLKVLTNIRETVATTGANGTTKILADNLQALGQQLLAEGKIDQKTANLFTDLANQGHRIASIQAVVEDAAASSGNSVNTFSNKEVSFEGKTYDNAYELSKVFAVSGEGSGKPKTGTELAKFQALENALMKSLDPSTKATVQLLTGQIEDIATTLEDKTYNIMNKNEGLPNELNALTASELTNTDSAEICGIGGGADSGQFCS